MALAMFRCTSRWLALLCVAVMLAFIGQGAAQAFENAEHAGHHATQTEVHHHCDLSGHDEPAGHAGEGHHHHGADHHSVGLAVDGAWTSLFSTARASLSPSRSVHRPGLAGYGIERPPKA
jgi:hypothetical protein